MNITLDFSCTIYKTRQLILDVRSQSSSDFWGEDNVWREYRRILGERGWRFSFSQAVDCLRECVQFGKTHLSVHL